MTSTQHQRLAIVTMWAGLILSLVAAIVPFIDRATSNMLADHIRSGYPDYSDGRIDTAVTTWLVYLSVVGVLGAASWIWTIRAVKAGKRWARPGATAMFALGVCIALTNLFIRDTSGDTGLPVTLGLVGLLPCLAGLLAIYLLWKDSRPTLR